MGHCTEEEFFSDGLCDSYLNLQECLYDGGDCCIKESDCSYCAGNECICHKTGLAHCKDGVDACKYKYRIEWLSFT